MARIYVVAGLDARPLHFSNASKLWASIKSASGNFQVWHGAPTMDEYRLKPVNNYGGLKRALERDNYTDTPVFWNDNGAVRVLKITRCNLL